MITRMAKRTIFKAHTVVLLAACLFAGVATTMVSDARADGATALPQGPTPPVIEARADADLFDPVTAQGVSARGMYFTGPFAHRQGAAGIIRTLRNARLDAAVIDVKTDRGPVLFNTQVPAFRDTAVNVLGDAHALIQELKAAGIYTIARLVCFNDPVTPLRHPELAVLDGREHRRGQIWRSGGGGPWLDPSNPANHEAIRQLAVEVEALGFDEIQLDYVRFPVDRTTNWAIFPHSRPGVRRHEYLTNMLRMIDESIHIPLGVDIFGVAALHEGDTNGLGQLVENWVQYVEVFQPMLYANNFRSWHASPGQDRGESFVRTATAILRRRVGARAVIRPYLQAFSIGAGRPFDEAMIAGYVRAARDAHADGFLFWNPAANYGTVSRSMNGRARDLSPFPVSATELPTRREPQPTTAETPVLAVPIAAASQRVSLR
ncbi:MAG: hypothetical protein IPK60_18205 [Sandaracinaceae bacterium]|nr:hypothetical protein [Sandaracinaceae bacterium]